jgi:hypothetical protein
MCPQSLPQQRSHRLASAWLKRTLGSPLIDELDRLVVDTHIGHVIDRHVVCLSILAVQKNGRLASRSAMMVPARESLAPFAETVLTTRESQSPPPLLLPLLSGCAQSDHDWAYDQPSN